MSAKQESLPRELTPQETAATLQRILNAVEEDVYSRWVEIICAFVLGLATMASAWCAYQSTLWGDVQTFRLAEVNKAGRESMQLALVANQLRAGDGQLAIAYMDAKGRGDDKLAKFYYVRFHPVAKTAFDAWLKSNPFNDHTTPKRPFESQEYVEPELQEAKRLDAAAAQMHKAAQEADQTSSAYVLLTVLFSSVLFVGGIVGTFRARPLRLSLLAVAVVLFLAAVSFMVTLPRCHY